MRSNEHKGWSFNREDNRQNVASWQLFRAAIRDGNNEEATEENSSALPKRVVNEDIVHLIVQCKSILLDSLYVYKN